MQIPSLTLAFYDTETTHLSHHQGEVIQFGLILIKEGEIIKKVERKIKPRHIETAHPKALEINGYNEEEWKEALDPVEAALELADLLKDTLLIAHNAPFDIRHTFQFFLTNKVQFDISSLPYIDTKVLAKQIFKDQFKSYSLDNLRDSFGWSKIAAHTALKDAEDCCRLFYACTSQPCPLDRDLTWELDFK